MANTEAAVIQWLNSILTDGWKAYGNKPKQQPAKYILVDRTGGPREAMVQDQAEILIEVYHKTSRSTASVKADDIAGRIFELLAYEENISRAKVTSVVNLDDTIAQFYRYQIYCDVFNRP